MIKSKFLITALLGISLTGCGTLDTNSSMYSVHQPVVERTNYAIDVNTSGNGISSTEQVRVAEWLDALKLGYGDRVALDYGDSYSNAAAKQDVANLAEKHGMLMVDTAPVTPGNVAPGTVRLVVTRSKASVPSCPDWSKTSDRNYNGANHSNYGCATNTNIAAMVADPEDLIRGRATDRMDNSTSSKAVKALRDKPASAGVTGGGGSGSGSTGGSQ
jgi:pilus assembly protein CpaD